MAVLDNINQGEFADLLRRVRILENRTTLNNSAIGRGGMEVYDGGVLNISNGGLVVNGSAQIVGTLNADGTINMTGLFIASGEMRLNGTVVATGDFNIDGPLIVDGNTTFNGTLNITGVTTIEGDTTVTGKLITNGPVDINGLTKIVGNLEIKGTTTLTGDLNVTGAGKIKIGTVLTLDPAESGGAIRFTSGRVIRDTGSSIIMDNGSGSATVTVTSSHAMLEAGSAKVDVVGNVVGIVGELDATGPVYMSLPETSAPANVHIAADGRLYKSTA